MRFKGKKCLITGGTSGVGLTAAELLLKEGAKVIILGRDKKKGEDVIKQLNGEVVFIQCDVSDHYKVKDVFNKIVKSYGTIDCAFNNAGITSMYGKIGELPFENWQEVMKVNLDGIYNSLYHELNLMSEGNGGSIVNMSSCVGITPIGFQSAYVTSKYAINGLTKAAAIEYANLNSGKIIRVNAIAPGPILGGMNSEEKLKANPEKTKKKIEVTAMKRFATPIEVATVVLWLLSEDSSYITGSIIPVDGGYNAGKF